MATWGDGVMTTTSVTATPPTRTTPVSTGVKTSVLISTVGTAIGMGAAILVTVTTTGSTISVPIVCLPREGSGKGLGVTNTSGAMTVWNCVTITSPYVATRLGATVKTFVVVEASRTVERNVEKDVELRTLVIPGKDDTIPVMVPVIPGATGIVVVLSITTGLDMVITRVLVVASTTVDSEADMVMLMGTKVTKVVIGTREPVMEPVVRDVVEEPATLPWEPPPAVLDVEPDETAKLDTLVAVVPVDALVEELPDDSPFDVDVDTTLDVDERLEDGVLDVGVLDEAGRDVDVVGGVLVSLTPSPITAAPVDAPVDAPVAAPVVPTLLTAVFEVVIGTDEVVAATRAMLVELSPTARANRRRRSPRTTVGLMPRNSADVSESGMTFWAAMTRAMATHRRAMTAARKGHRSGVGL